MTRRRRSAIAEKVSYDTHSSLFTDADKTLIAVNERAFNYLVGYALSAYAGDVRDRFYMHMYIRDIIREYRLGKLADINAPDSRRADIYSLRSNIYMYITRGRRTINSAEMGNGTYTLVLRALIRAQFLCVALLREHVVDEQRYSGSGGSSRLRSRVERKRSRGEL